MAFTFFCLGLFSWVFYFFYFSIFSPLKSWAHFSPDTSSPCCGLPCWQGHCAGAWVVEPNPCTCSHLSPCHPPESSILGFLSGLNRGRTEKQGPSGEIFFTKFSYFPWVVKFSEDEICCSVWPSSAAIPQTPQEDRGDGCTSSAFAHFLLQAHPFLPATLPSALLLRKSWKNWD